MANRAWFTINGTAAATRGFDATNGQVLTFALESVASLAQRWTLEVYSPSDEKSPLASKNAPLLTLVGTTSGQKVDATTPAASITTTMPSGVHSYKVRSTVNGGLDALGEPDPDLVFERIISMRSGGRRKIIAGEGTEYAPGGWADAQNDDVDAGGGGGGGYATIKDAAGAAQTQRAILKFAGPGAPAIADVAGETVLTFTAAGGGVAGIPMTFFASTVDGDPTAGGIRLSHATPASATSLYVDDVESEDGTNIRDLLAALGTYVGATVTLRSKSANENWIVYKVGGYTAASGYSKLTGLTVVDSSATVTLSTTIGDTTLSIDFGVPKDLGNQGLTGVKGIGFNGIVSTTGATPAVNFTTGDFQRVNLNANCTPTWTLPPGIGWVQVEFVQDTTPRTVDFTAGGVIVGSPPQPSAVSGSKNKYAFFCNGTNLEYVPGVVLGGTTLSNGVAGLKLRDGTANGQEWFWDGSQWWLVSRETGTALTDANATLQYTTACQYVWPPSVDTAATRTLTLGITGLSSEPMAGNGCILSIEFARASYTSTINIVNGGPGGGTLYTVPVAKGKTLKVSFYFDGTNWALAGQARGVAWQAA